MIGLESGLWLPKISDLAILCLIVASFFHSCEDYTAVFISLGLNTGFAAAHIVIIGINLWVNVAIRLLACFR